MAVTQMPIDASDAWHVEAGHLKRRDLNFFSVVGVRVLGAQGPRGELDQPLIRQTEIGILGFVLSESANGKEILVQSKSEPGNVPICQLAPTVQATVSNYERRHGGAPTMFLEFFVRPGRDTVVADSLQSEQGRRFLGKYNRNMTLLLAGEDRPEANEYIRWFPLADFLPLLAEDFVINTDARSVIATTPWCHLAVEGQPFAKCQGAEDWTVLLAGSYAQTGEGRESRIAYLLDFLQRARERWQFQVREVALQDLVNWQVQAGEIRRSCGTMAIRQFRIATDERETSEWDQPLFACREEGRVVLLGQVRGGRLGFLFSCRAEPGFKECVQFGPTLQSPDHPQAWIHEEHRDTEAYLQGLSRQATTVISCLHSDEGGRFYRCVSRYAIQLLAEDMPVRDDLGVAWMTLAEVEALVARQGVFTNEARSLVSMLLAYV